MTALMRPPPMALTLTDEAFMSAALSLGRRNLGRTAPNPAVGALVVRDGVIVARGWTGLGGRPHAERIALEAAGEAARGATLYATLEPCSHHGATPPCVDAIIGSGVARMVSAIDDPDPRVAGRGHAVLREAGVEVVTNVCAAAARRDHGGHILRVTERRPKVTLKLAQTADGYAAGAEHDPRLFITGRIAESYTHAERALHDAIMVGIGTARVDDPLMTVRLAGVTGAKPLRVILDARLSLSARSRIAETARETPTLVIAGEGVSDDAAHFLSQATGVEIARVATNAAGRIELLAALRLLAQRGVTRVFSEGGPRVAESLIMSNYADEVILLTGMKPLGREGVPALSLKARELLRDSMRYRTVEDVALGADRLTRFERVD
jgi:diaminohydroxyphosphoribosylaminopyrimidine deaminase/5-amino-6-(5-phosphoribosylamino)uracil reductase